MKPAVLIPVFVAAGIGSALWLKPRVSGSDGAPGDGSERRAGAASAREPRAATADRGGPPIIRLKARSPVVLDPARPDYDPVKVVDQTDRSPQDVFANEPRDEAWASALEQKLGGLLSRDFAADFPDAEVASVECRASSCSISLKVDRDDSESANAYAQLYVLLGATVAPGVARRADDGDHILTYYGLLSPEMRDPDDFAALYERDREQRGDRLEEFRRQLRERRGAGAAP